MKLNIKPGQIIGVGRTNFPHDANYCIVAMVNSHFIHVTLEGGKTETFRIFSGNLQPRFGEGPYLIAKRPYLAKDRGTVYLFDEHGEPISCARFVEK